MAIYKKYRRRHQNWNSHAFFTAEQSISLLAVCLLPPNRSVTLYYSGRTDLSLRCFRIALFIRHKLLECSERHVLQTEKGEPASDMDGDLKRGADYRSKDSDAVAAEAGETAAAVTLNNFAVCLAVTGETGRAVQAFITSSTITT